MYIQARQGYEAGYSEEASISLNQVYPARTHRVNEEGYWATKPVRRHRASQKTTRRNIKEHHWGQDTGKALALEVIGAAK